MTPLTTLVPGESDLTWDMGIKKRLAQIGNRVWYDNNRNGIQDSGELGVQGVKVWLIDFSSKEVLEEAVTDTNGEYLFTELPADYYIIRFKKETLPEGYEFTKREVGTDDSVDSDANLETGRAHYYTYLSSGESDLTWDAGLVINRAQIGDRVWVDSNRDGVQDASETGVGNIGVSLIDSNGDVVATTTTSANGDYLFDNLEPGDYKVSFDLSTLPAGYVVTGQNLGGDDALDSDANPTTGMTQLTTLDPGESDLSWDMGIYQPVAQIGDRVWIDSNRDGVQDAGEAGVGNIGVSLTDSNGDVVATTTTDASGDYLFDNLEPGDYKVSFDVASLPAGYVVTGQNLGGDDAFDSDANPTTGMTELTTLEAGESDLTWDMGIYQPVAQIGDRVWIDSNRDGVQDAGEAGVGNIGVSLTDSNGDVVATTTTDANGDYLFDNLEPGDYKVSFDVASLPAGYVVTGQNLGGDDALDSDASPTTGMTELTTLEAGESDLTWDMGIYQPTAQIGDRVWIDSNRDGVQDAGEAGVGNIGVSLTDSNGDVVATTTTDANGDYLFDTLEPGDYKVSFDVSTLPAGYVVTGQNLGGDDALDSDANPTTGMTELTTLEAGESDLTWDMGIYQPVAQIGDRVWIDSNRDGVQDAGEAGVGNIGVSLTDSNGDVVATTTTDASGDYLFDTLEPGDYKVSFDVSTLPAGYVVTGQNLGGDDALDSDANPTTGMTELTTLEAGESDLSWDMGIYQPTAQIGDRVWIDSNRDSVQDAGEAGVANIGVSLTDSNGDVVATTTTDANGDYLFDTLEPGDYKVSFDVATLPAGYVVTGQNLGGDDALDSDANPSTGMTQLTTLDAGESDLSWDMGIYELHYDLALIKKLADAQSAQVALGDIVDYLIVVKNQGDLNSGLLTVQDTIPSGMNFVSYSGLGFDCVEGATLVCSYNANLAPQETAELTISLKVNDVTHAPYRNWAEITSSSGVDVDSTPDNITGSDNAAGTGTLPNDNVVNHNDIDHDALFPDPNDEDDNDYEDVSVEVNYDLALIKVLADGQTAVVNPGDNISFVVEVKNQGNVPSGSFVITDTLPNGLDLVATSGINFSCGAGAIITCDYNGSLLPDQSALLTIEVAINDFSAAPYRNVAEISSDSSGDYGINDSDSTPDTNPANDPVVDHNDINHDAMVQDPLDEDDHDYEDVSLNIVYDLALIKTLASSQPALVNPGDEVNYVVDVKNQGNVESGSFTVTDHIPAGMDYILSSGTNWSCVQSGQTLSCTYSGSLAAGEITMLNIRVKVVDFSLAPFRNWAEITSDSSSDYGVVDNDSTADSNIGSDNGVGTGIGPNDPVVNHNDIDHDATVQDPLDEDDNDYEDVGVNVNYDLALIKVLAAGQSSTVVAGDLVRFTLTVFNQGNVPASNIELTDSIPAGLTFDGAQNPNWSMLGGQVVTTISGPIPAGASSSVDVIFTVGDGVAIGTLRNIAEISNDDGEDADSTPDNDSSNDIIGGDNVTDNSNSDEDDHDYADIEVVEDGVFDLALRKRLADGQSFQVVVGNDASFTIEIHNQGNQAVNHVEIIDVIPQGMVLADSDWIDNGDGTASYIVMDSIAPGEVKLVDITLHLMERLTRYGYNHAEIVGALDENGNLIVDIDSTPDSDNTNDIVVDNEINNAGTDEDDHDIERIRLIK